MKPPLFIIRNGDIRFTRHPRLDQWLIRNEWRIVQVSIGLGMIGFLLLLAAQLIGGGE